MASVLNIGLVGAGVVGGGVVKILAARRDIFAKQFGVQLRLARVADLNAQRLAELPVGDAVVSASAADIVNDPSIHVVIELVGGTGFARKLVLDAIAAKKHVVTANKALLAEHGPEIFSAAERAGVTVWFEAAVGGGIPVIKALREGLTANKIQSIQTIINGTCNYILTNMSQRGVGFDEALKEAQQKGYAEADPTLDVGGGDTGHKLAIAASIAGRGYVPYEKISIAGIQSIAREDILFADELGYCIKLLGIMRQEGDKLDCRVHPTMLPKSHILASVNGVFNAMRVVGDSVGEVLLYGRGAGELPTASAVVADLVDIARDLARTDGARVSMHFYDHHHELPLLPISEVRSHFYLRFAVEDKPGVVAKIATALSAEGISIASLMQKEMPNPVPVVFLTHVASEASVRRAIANIEAAGIAHQKTQVIFVER
jgi:homoserine dehydrogenase